MWIIIFQIKELSNNSTLSTTYHVAEGLERITVICRHNPEPKHRTVDTLDVSWPYTPLIIYLSVPKI